MRLLRLLLLLPSLTPSRRVYFHCARHGTAGKKILLLLLLFQGAASAAYSALTEAHMDERGSRPRCPLAYTDLIERRENPPGEICEIVPGRTVGDKVARQPIRRE